jgi:hypothetical protein
LNDVHPVSIRRASLDLHRLITYDAVEQIDERAFIIIGKLVKAVPHFFAFSPSSTSRLIASERVVCFSAAQVSTAETT